MSLSKTVSGWADEIRKMQGGGSSKAKALGKAKMAKTNPRKAGASMSKGKEEKLETRSKKAGYYVHGHKNYGDVYED